MALGGLRGVPLVMPNTHAQVLTPTHTLASISRHKQTTASTLRPTPSEGRLNNPSGIKLKRYGVPHPYPLPSLWRSSHQEFSWADSEPYGIPISVEFL